MNTRTKRVITKLTKTLFTFAVLVFGLLTLTSNVIAATIPKSNCNGDGSGLCTEAKGGDTLTPRLNGIIEVLLFIAGVLAVIIIVVSGIKYMTANGNKSTIESAKSTLIYAVVGLIVVIAAYAIVEFILGKI